MDFHIKHKLFPFQKEDCGVWSQHCYFTSADEHIVFHTMVADSVVLLNKRVPFAGSGYAVCRMNFGAKKVSRKMENNMDFLADNYRFLTSTPEITSKYVIGSYWHDNEVGSDPYIYDVKKQKVHINNYEAGDVSKFFFPALFHDGDTIFSLYNKDYYSLFEEGDRTFDLLPDKVKKHLDAGDDVLIKYILK
ncbi:MAG: hypothetical protein LBR08_00075 [Bacteroidales bacterium]|jgi:hypothetical protein|nr:hypothetical protein [Bacteroidales bacterium]